MSTENERPEWRDEYVELSKLVPYAQNPRIIKGKKFDDLKKSLDKFGLAQPIVVNKDYTIISGHARCLALREMHGETHKVRCLVPNRVLTESEVKELNMRFNKNIAGEWDFEGLANWFGIDELKEWGFEDHEFGNFEFGEESEQGKLDEIAGGESKMYTCPNCNHQWKAEKKKKTKED